MEYTFYVIASLLDIFKYCHINFSLLSIPRLFKTSESIQLEMYFMYKS